MRRVGVMMIGAALIASGCASGSRSRGSLQRQSIEPLLAHFDSLRSTARIPGLAVVMLRDTELVAARGFGLADIEGKRAVTAETPFNIASVAKPISAVV